MVYGYFHLLNNMPISDLVQILVFLPLLNSIFPVKVVNLFSE
jgi:hypothetical protein